MGSSRSLLCLLWVPLFIWGSFVLVKRAVEASPRLLQNLQLAKDSIASPQYKTAFHFQPPKNWINDPNGPMYYNGVYHLFYQYNPNAAVWGDIIWGHSVSTDLVNWTRLPPAITRTDPFDVAGCWTGSATILPGNKPIILYTGANARKEQVQNVAFPKNLSDPHLAEWTKPSYNPVISPVDGTDDPAQFRDPTTGWLGKDGYWRVLVGNTANGTGMALLYRSRDFIRWARAPDPLHSVAGSGMWECPDFFPVAANGTEEGLDTSVNDGKVKHVLKASIGDPGFDHYVLGRYVEEKDVFVADDVARDNNTGLRYDYGKFYASKTFFDGRRKRRVLWGWVNEMDTAADDVAKGWAGIQSIPRAVWLDKIGKQLIQWPVEELKSLRTKQVQLANKELKSGDLFEIMGLSASQADTEIDFDIPNLGKAEALDSTVSMGVADAQKLCSQKGTSYHVGIGPFGLLVLASEQLEEYTAVFFKIYKAQGKYVTLMCSDQSRSSLRTEVLKPVYGGFVDIDINKTRTVSLRTLIDHSVVESFGANGRTCITSRVYPTALARGVALLYAFNNGSEAVNIASLRAWEMAKAHIS